MHSNFSDVFDEDHFINALSNDVKITKKLPKELATGTRAVKHFRSWSGMDYYQDEIASMWEEYEVRFLEYSGTFFFCKVFFEFMKSYSEKCYSFQRLFELQSLILV